LACENRAWIIAYKRIQLPNNKLLELQIQNTPLDTEYSRARLSDARFFHKLGNFWRSATPGTSARITAVSKNWSANRYKTVLEWDYGIRPDYN
jgi:hypothetical protein